MAVGKSAVDLAAELQRDFFHPLGGGFERVRRVGVRALQLAAHLVVRIAQRLQFLAAQVQLRRRVVALVGDEKRRHQQQPGLAHLTHAGQKLAHLRVVARSYLADMMAITEDVYQGGQMEDGMYEGA